MDSFDTIAAVVWMTIGTSVVALLARLIQRGSALLTAQESHVRSAAARDALEFATREAAAAAETVVQGLNQSVVGQLKAQGKWDGAAAKAVKAQAVAQLRSALSADSKAVLGRSMGDLGTYLDTLVEASVAHAKAAAPRAS